MKVKSDRNYFIEKLPFAATADETEKTVRFNTGKIFDCYNYQNSGVLSFQNGSFYCEPVNINNTFTYEFGDKFFLDVKGDISKSEIKKQSEGGSITGERLYLLWAAPTSELTGKQYISENIFIQDIEANKKFGFSIYKSGESDSEITYTLNSGFVIVPEVGFVKYLEGFDFSVGRDGSNNQTPYVKLTVSSEISEEDPIRDANLSLIKNYTVNSASIELLSEEPENNYVQLSLYDNSLNGEYYFELPNRGNLIVNFSAETKERITVSPGSVIEVRAAEYFKNGVSTLYINGLLPFGYEVSEDEAGYYSSAEVVIEYPRYSTSDDGSGGFLVTRDGEHVVTYNLSVAGDVISESAPTVIQDVTSTELAENQFAIFNAPSNATYSLFGQEISLSAYNKTLVAVKSLEFTNANNWTGTTIPLNFGAGRNGKDNKTFEKVIHSEKRFKQTAILLGEETEIPYSIIDRKEEIPSEFTHYSVNNSTGGAIDEEENITVSIKYFDSELRYIAPNWNVLKIYDSDGVYTNNNIRTNCDVQSNESSYLSKDITKLVYDYWQRLVPTRN